jgi:hypothetical protein
MGRWAQKTRQNASNSRSTIAFKKTAALDAIDDTIVHVHRSQPIPPTTFDNSDFHDDESGVSDNGTLGTKNATKRLEF